MYQWVPNEEITAAKLNAMQNRPNMEGVDKNGLGLGGLDDSALSSDVIDSDGGTWSTIIPEDIIIEEHEVGNAKYEYDKGSEKWKIRTGRAGLTGVRNSTAGELKWLCKSQLPADAKQYLYQKIDTDSYGNPITVSMCVKTNAAMSSSTWDPVTCTPGTIWRRMASIEPDTNLNPNPSCKKSWAMKVVNENNALTMPIARRYGVIQNWDNIVIKEAEDVQDRGSSSHWAPVMFGESGLSNLIQSVGELGGVFVYQTKEGCGSEADYGIGLASGIEFYDDVTLKECYNCHDTRPKSTRACAPLGPGGKYGKIVIQSVNKKHPWQFSLSADLDIGSHWDPGSHWIDEIPLANGPLGGTFTNYNWAGRGDDPVPEMTHGLADGSVTRLLNNYILWCGQYSDWCGTYRPGEINQGGIGIGTAQFKWETDFDKNDPKKGNVIANRNGGLVTGIFNDSTCRSYIDCQGFIHTSDPEWMGKYGVKLQCANAKLTNYIYGQSAYPHYLWPVFDKTEWCHEGTTPFGNNYNCGGKVTGEIIAIKPVVGGKTDTPQLYPDANGNQYLWPEMGEVLCGTIGIPNAYFEAYGCVNGNESEFMMEWLTADPPVDELQYKMSPGIIRGVMADIEWQQLHVDKNGEYVYPPEGETWPVDELPDCVERVEFFPEVAPYIDQNGLLHLPFIFYSSDKEEFTCCGNKKTRLVNFMPDNPGFIYKEPQDPPPPTPPTPEGEGNKNNS